MQSKNINIAVDGFSSCGKSTIARGLARQLGYTYIDSGAMYRSVALFAIRNGWITDSEMDEEHLRQHIGDIRITFKGFVASLSFDNGFFSYEQFYAD